MMSSFSFSAFDVVLGTVVGIIAIAAIIFAGRRYFTRKADEDLAAKYKGKQWSSPLEARNKYPDVDVFQLRPYFLRLGLIGALALVFGAFNVTTLQQKIDTSQFGFSVDADVEIEVPRSQDAPPPPPPPPPPTVQEIVTTEFLTEEEDISFVDQSVEAETNVEAPPQVHNDRVAPPPPPPPPPPRAEEPREIFVVVEEMPRFPGCENIQGDAKAKKACSDKKLMEFIYENIQYPAIARENGIEGTVVAQFVVNTDGSVTDVTIARDIGAGCGEEATRIVNLMNGMTEKWIPGKQRGRSVRVMFTLPIRFKLQYN